MSFLDRIESLLVRAEKLAPLLIQLIELVKASGSAPTPTVTK